MVNIKDSITKDWLQKFRDSTLWTDTFSESGYHDCLHWQHQSPLTLATAASKQSVVDNQTSCDLETTTAAAFLQSRLACGRRAIILVGVGATRLGSYPGKRHGQRLLCLPAAQEIGNSSLPSGKWGSLFRGRRKRERERIFEKLFTGSHKERKRVKKEILICELWEHEREWIKNKRKSEGADFGAGA